MARTLTENARRYRNLMWLLVLAAAVALSVAVAGARGMLPVALGLAGGALCLVSLGLASLMGFRAHRQTLADREMQARRGMIVMLAATLGQQDDAALARIERQGGPAGEAAALILEGRRAKSVGAPHPGRNTEAN